MFPFDEEALSAIVLCIQLATLAGALVLVSLGYYIYYKTRK